MLKQCQWSYWLCLIAMKCCDISTETDKLALLRMYKNIYIKFEVYSFYSLLLTSVESQLARRTHGHNCISSARHINICQMEISTWLGYTYDMWCKLKSELIATTRNRRPLTAELSWAANQCSVSFVKVFFTNWRYLGFCNLAVANGSANADKLSPAALHS